MITPLKPLAIQVTSSITIQVHDVELKLNLDEAKKLYTALGQIIGQPDNFFKNNLTYPAGVRGFSPEDNFRMKTQPDQR